MTGDREVIAFYDDALAHGVRSVPEVLAGKKPQKVYESGVAEVRSAARYHRDACRD